MNYCFSMISLDFSMNKRLLSSSSWYDQQDWCEYSITDLHCMMSQDRQQGQQVLQQGLSLAKGISRMRCSLSAQHTLTLVTSM